VAKQLPNIPPYILQSGEIRVISSLQEGTLLNLAEAASQAPIACSRFGSFSPLSRIDDTESDYYDYEAFSP
jgi:hypothetical protein